MYVTKRLVDKYGKTKGCGGSYGGGRAPHSRECRERIKAMLKEDPEGKEIMEREEQRYERHFQRALHRGIDANPELRKQQDELDRQLGEIKRGRYDTGRASSSTGRALD